MSKFDNIEIKAPQRSTHNLSHTLRDTYNVGDLNLLYARRCTPTDFIKMKWDTLIKFNPLQTPAFCHMRWKTWAFFVPTSQIDNTFEPMIQDVKKEGTKYIENGVQHSETIIAPAHVTPTDINLFMSMPNMTFTTDHPTQFETKANLTFGDRFYIGRLSNQVGLPSYCCVPYDTNVEEENPQFAALKSVYGNTYFVPKGIRELQTNSWSTDFADEFDHWNVGMSEHGLQSVVDSDLHLDLNVWRAYQHIWNEYFRDARLDDKIDLYKDCIGGLFDHDNGLQDIDTQNQHGTLIAYIRRANSLLRMRKVCYSKDYFNTASTDPTLGAQSLSLPANITGLRKTNALQKFLEKKALGGSRFADFLLMHFGQTPNNYELERPIYLGHSSQPIQISETLQTSQSTDDSAQGTRTGNANSFGNSNGFAFTCPDYGYVIVVGALIPEIDYYQGVNRKLVVDSWESFPFPEFANIGMQEIKQSEVLLAPVGLEESAETSNDSAFGYAPRYIEFKHELNRIQGDFAQPWLNMWHQSPDFLKLFRETGYFPHLNQYFPKVGFDLSSYRDVLYNGEEFYNRIFAYTKEDYNHTQAQTYFDISVNTPLPANELPKL